MLLAWAKSVGEAYCLSRWRVTGVAVVTAPPPVLVAVGVTLFVVVVELPTAPAEASATFRSRIRWRVASRIYRCGTELTKPTARVWGKVAPGTDKEVILPGITVGTVIVRVRS